MDFIYSIILLALAGICGARFYIPIKKVKNWSWESYWIVQGLASWIIAPWIFALITVPALFEIFSETSESAIGGCILFGALWGVGGLTFGLSMRYLGVALGQSVALGFCASFGTLIPPIIAGQELLATHEGIMMIIGVAICIGGIFVIGFAGVLKSKNITGKEKNEALKEFALKKGLMIAVLAGVMSACMSYGIGGLEGFIDAGNIVNGISLSKGTNSLFVSTPTLILVLTGGFITNFIYCMSLNVKNKTFKDYVSVSSNTLISNILFSFIGGTIWYFQFFFYGMGQSFMNTAILPFEWSILMSMNIVFGNIWGIFLKEWKGVENLTKIVLVSGILILILSTFIIKL